ASEPKTEPATGSRADVSNPTSPAVSDTDRIRALEDALHEQRDQINQMQKLIEEQQRMMQLLNGKTAAGSSDAARAQGSANVSSTAVNSTPAKDAAPVAEASAPQNQPSLEDRFKKVEERVLKIGPVRVG